MQLRTRRQGLREILEYVQLDTTSTGPAGPVHAAVGAEMERRMAEVAVAAMALSKLSLRETETNRLLAHLLEVVTGAEHRRCVGLVDMVKHLCAALNAEDGGEDMAEFVLGYFDEGMGHVKAYQSSDYDDGVSVSRRYAAQYS